MSPDELMVTAKSIAVVWFFLLFVGIVAYAYWPGNKKRFERMGRTILDDAE